MTILCKYCNKEYASYASRSNHIKKFHIVNTENIQTEIAKTSPKIKNISPEIANISLKKDNIICEHCKITFTRIDSLRKHNNRCKIKNNEDNKLKQENEQLKEIVEKVKKEKEEMKQDIELLKKQMLEIMNKQNKIHPKTLTKINKQLNNNTIINNNINIIQLGGESLDTLFNKNQQIDVLNKKYKCLEYLVKQIHFNDNYPQFKNILITNTQNNIGYRYDKIENKFIAINKNELLDDVITERMGDIENFYDNQLQYLDSRTKDIIHCFIAKMSDKNEKYYEQKMKDIKLVIYNNRNKVSKEITHDLEIIV